ncbi:uncharacterized protein LOC110629277 [Manihot esculenta]|uniref:uncharacterized protein LOC110629277 n=1 Tax=Manihot esculenta TaxID=3983 RepID=UPI000B5D3013|nr:uncharacterized protein LOC110629277 [Manihot esculenta]
MKAYLKTFDMWEVTESGKEPALLRDNPTVTQIKAHSEECAKGFKAMSCLHSFVSDVIFTRIMACESAKEAWDRLKEELQGSESLRQITILNLRREFEVLKIKESKTLKEYIDRLMAMVNKIRLLAEDLIDKRVEEKVLMSLLERFESKISSLEDSKDLSKITLRELINSLQATKQKRFFRQEYAFEKAFVTIHKGKQDKQPESGSSAAKKGKFPPCSTYRKINHLEKDCWQKNGIKPVQCHYCKKYGHISKDCIIR